MTSQITFRDILTKYRQTSLSERQKGDKFERLMQAYLQTDPMYAPKFANVWLWNDFPARVDFGGNDTGIDLVAKTNEGNYWAIQCKCYAEDTAIDKPEVDTFISTSGRNFTNPDDGEIVGFLNRLWIDTTTKKWSSNAEESIHNQEPPVSRINLFDLENAPVNWQKIDSGLWGDVARTTQKTLFRHQETALNEAHNHYTEFDRGKMIMACGTGKTFTSLRIAENETNGKGLILFLVPSIALLSQTLREWTAEAKEPIHAICICSDPAVVQKRKQNEDTDGFSTVDLALPASTWYPKIVKQLKDIKSENKPGMTVVFSTYQSIEVIAKAQEELLSNNIALPFGEGRGGVYGIFDMVICDEAHRTTGVTLKNEDASAFVRVHDNKFIKAKKRLYMTATPRLYHPNSKSTADRAEAVLCSMDDPKLYGEEFYRIGFGEAVEKGLLSDYKVLILTVTENDMPAAVQEAVAKKGEISSDDALKLIGCINALSKKIMGDGGVLAENDPKPMRRAVAFCQSIPNSKSISNQFKLTNNAYSESITPEAREKLVMVDARHVDGTMNAPERERLLNWLKEDSEECRVLTNVRCLSEGVDVPSLDAVLFISAKNSEIEVVQSVGRVMRRAPGKQYGYIIIPVVIPVSVDAHIALDDNNRYAVVWTVLNALRAHDDRFNATVNKIELNKKKPDNILVGGIDNGNNDSSAGNSTRDFGVQLSLQFEQLQDIVFARMVEKVGDRRYWEQWAADVAVIAERQIERINNLIKQNPQHQAAFNEFLTGLHKNINPAITQGEAVEMLAQHMITKPVFEALFEGYSFVKNNPISISMQQMLDLLEENTVEKDTETLQRFYESVKKRASDIDNAAARQKIIVELYDKFFKTAFPKMVEKLGIVYTPVEVVDFIVQSVEVILQKEFSRSISDENVQILDPFTGTGTFMTRLLQSGLIKPKDLERKYKHELHANEIVLLAYYIAAINIENTYHEMNKGIKEFQPFDGICLTDTFQLGESDDNEQLFSKMFPQNSHRVQAQKKAPLTVIIGNPPYSVGQKAANDNAQNQSYPKLDNRIAETYAKQSTATSKISLYDSYVKAFRWASDRLEKKGGIIAFITNSGWIDKGAANGIRKSFSKEFTSIYMIDLKGAIRGKSGEAAKREGQNVFDIMTGVAVTILVKNPNEKTDANIKYYNIGDYLKRNDKINFLKENTDFSKINWSEIIPNTDGDWINKRSSAFENLIPICDKDDDNSSIKIFNMVSNGTKSQRDTWCYNFSKNNLLSNISKTILFYNHQRELLSKDEIKEVSYDSSEISWSVNLLRDIQQNKQYIIDKNCFLQVIYRPFCKQNWYSSKLLNERISQSFKIFPKENFENISICVSGLSSRLDNTSVFITNFITDLNCLDSGTQCFPLYYYEEQKDKPASLFESISGNEYERKDGISDFILAQAHKIYGNKVGKEDIFYYVYGFLHSPLYREKFASDLKKMLPRLPLVDDAKDFWAFSRAGRQLAALHINYETVPPAEGVKVVSKEPLPTSLPFGEGQGGVYKVDKMRFPAKDRKDTINYNSKITIENIPAAAYEYVVNGKSAIEWIMERYQITTNKDSNIKNDPNDWSEEVGNPRYILDLLLSIIRVSTETMEIVKSLPELKFE